MSWREYEGKLWLPWIQRGVTYYADGVKDKSVDNALCRARRKLREAA